MFHSYIQVHKWRWYTTYMGALCFIWAHYVSHMCIKFHIGTCFACVHYVHTGVLFSHRYIMFHIGTLCFTLGHYVSHGYAMFQWVHYVLHVWVMVVIGAYCFTWVHCFTCIVWFRYTIFHMGTFCFNECIIFHMTFIYIDMYLGDFNATDVDIKLCVCNKCLAICYCLLICRKSSGCIMLIKW